jgi:hypothetical protein
MIRTLNILLACTSAVALVGVYGIKYAAEETAGQKVTIERQIERQEGELSLLRADWAYLNQPSHVAPIVLRNAAALGLVPTSPKQFGSLADLAMRPVVKKDEGALDELFLSLEAGIDPAEQSAED